MRIARKHLGWYTEALAGGAAFRREVQRRDRRAEQLAAVQRFFDRLQLRASGSSTCMQRGDAVDARAALMPSQPTTSNAIRAGEALAA